MQRIRIYYAKTQALRYTGNLDMQKIWERYLRRCGLSLAYSQGFHPQARINQAAALPLGMLSTAELLDFWLEPDCHPVKIKDALADTFQPGITVHGFAQVDLRMPSLQTQVESAEYIATVLEDDPLIQGEFSQLSQRIQSVLSAQSIIREWRRKTYDLRSLIHGLTITADKDDGLLKIWMHLTAKEGATGRPEEVLSSIGIDAISTRIERVRLHLR